MTPNKNAPKVIPPLPAEAKKHPAWAKFSKALTGKMSAPDIEECWLWTLEGILDQEALNKKNKPAGKVRSKKFGEIATKHASLLAVKSGKTGALWSGGYETSLYARKTYETLETTTLGGAYDPLDIYSDWDSVWPLWDALSAQYVKQAKGNMHVFLRVHCPPSTLYTQEVPSVSSGTKLPLARALWRRGTRDAQGDQRQAHARR